jgi:probable HAF family extracellular repeat protein
MLRTSLGVLTALLISATVLAAPPIYVIEEIAPLPGQEDAHYFAHDINDNGDVLASAQPFSGFQHYPFIVTSGGIQALDVSASAGYVRARAINNNGVVVGHYHNGHAFKYDSGTWSLVPGMQGNYSHAFDINDAGTIVGSTTFAGGTDWRAFRLIDGGVPEDLGSIDNRYSDAAAVNESNEVAGTSSTDYGSDGSKAEHAFIFKNNNGLVDIGTFDDDDPWSLNNTESMTKGSGLAGTKGGINDHGEIVGWAGDLNYGNDRAFFSTGNKVQGDYELVNLGALPDSGATSHAYDINNDGMVVGWSSAVSYYCCAAIFTEDEVHYLGDRVTNMGDWESLQRAYAINASGQIVGVGRKLGEDGDRAFRLTPLADTETLPIDIDIQPNDDNNYVETEGAYSDKMFVSVMGSGVLDASQIDAASVRFGPAEVAPHRVPGDLVDTNTDGYDDLKLMFRTGATGIVCEQIDAPVLTGEMLSGELFTGSDSVTTPDCPTAGCHP